MTNDPLVPALREVRQSKDLAEKQIRLLLAYGREVIAPRPFRLAELVQAAGMPISGVRSGYSPADAAFAAQLADTGTAEI